MNTTHETTESDSSAAIAAKKQRATFTHADVSQMTSAFHLGGATAVYAAFQGRFSVDSLNEKMESFGMVKLAESQRQEIGHMVTAINKETNKELFARALVAALKAEGVLASPARVKK